MSKTTKKKITKNTRLKVFEAYTRDVGRGVIRMDYDMMDVLNCSTGDTIQITGKKITVAKCLPCYPSDEGKGMIRTDGLVRNNAKTNIGETVHIMKTKSVKAESIIVEALESIPPIDAGFVADALESVPVVVGDNVMIPYFGGRLTFKIVNVHPPGAAVIITQKTQVSIKDQKPKEKEGERSLVLTETLMHEWINDLSSGRSEKVRAFLLGVLVGWEGQKPKGA